MTEKICPECNGEGVVDQGTEDRSSSVNRSIAFLSGSHAPRALLPIWTLPTSPPLGVRAF
jgi:hypothetical protein